MENVFFVMFILIELESGVICPLVLYVLVPGIVLVLASGWVYITMSLRSVFLYNFLYGVLDICILIRI